jgi:hypothetical protein
MRFGSELVSELRLPIPWLRTPAGTDYRRGSGEIRNPVSFTSDEKYLYHVPSMAPEYGAGVYLYIEVINKNVNAL